MRELDRLCHDEFGIPGLVLMENAGRGAAERLLLESADVTERFVFLCGPGNNGGDAFVAARHLHNRSRDVLLLATHSAADTRGDAAWARSVVERMGISIEPIVHDTGVAAAAEVERLRAQLSGNVILVDALLGTGAVGEPRGAVALALRAAREARPRLRVSLDLPSGLDADTGVAHELCFAADISLTFAARKPGLVASVAGRVVVIDIGAPRALLLRLQGT